MSELHDIARELYGQRDGGPGVFPEVRRLAELVLALPEPPTPVEPSEDTISRESVIEALRDAERNDSAADAVEFVSDLVGWTADSDEVLRAEREREELAERVPALGKADVLVSWLRMGLKPTEALTRVELSEDDVFSEDPCLALDDPDNDLIDLGWHDDLWVGVRRLEDEWVVEMTTRKETPPDGA